jgi:hypothetical protein
MDEPEAEGVVRLPGVPAQVFLESQDHQQDLIRELQLIEIGGRIDQETAHVSKRLAHLIDEVLTDYSVVRSATRGQAVAALSRGEHVVTLHVPVVPGMSEALQRWLRLLEEADELCEKGELLLVAPSPEVRRLRRWYVEQLTNQLVP